MVFGPDYQCHPLTQKVVVYLVPESARSCPLRLLYYFKLVCPTTSVQPCRSRKQTHHPPPPAVGVEASLLSNSSRSDFTAGLFSLRNAFDCGDGVRGKDVPPNGFRFCEGDRFRLY
jgi:hypothetical protein